MSKVFKIIAIITDVSQRKCVLIQLAIQVYLLAASIIFLSVATHILSQRTQCFDEDSSSEIKGVDTRAWIKMSEGGGSMVISGVLQILPSILCIIAHTYGYRFFAKVILLVHFLNGIGQALRCMDGVRNSGLATWLPAVVPLFVMAIMSHLYTCGFLITANVALAKQSPSPRIRLVSTQSSIDGPSLPSIAITQPLDFIQNPIDSFHRARRPRLPSLRNLHVVIPGSPILFEIPLTPQEMGCPTAIQNESNVTKSFEYPNHQLENHESNLRQSAEKDNGQLNVSESNLGKSIEYENVSYGVVETPPPEYETAAKDK